MSTYLGDSLSNREQGFRTLLRVKTSHIGTHQYILRKIPAIAHSKLKSMIKALQVLTRPY